MSRAALLCVLLAGAILQEPSASAAARKARATRRAGGDRGLHRGRANRRPPRASHGIALTRIRRGKIAPPRERNFGRRGTAYVHADKEAMASAAADLILGVVRKNPRARIMLSGGSTPLRAYELVRERMSPGELDRARLFFGDERAVAPDHPDSNFGAAQRALLGSVTRGDRNRIRGELGAERAAALADRQVRTANGRRPSFDLVLLGLGEDGHTASLFPGSPALRERKRLFVAAPEPPRESGSPSVARVTATLPLLNAAKHVVFLVGGEGKVSALRRTLRGPRGDTPASRVRARQISWLVDDAAAAGLR